MTRAAIRLRGVTAGYASPLWTALDLEVSRGEFIAVLGGNGAGKTTLLRLLLGQLAPTSGEVQVLGTRPRRAVPRVGYVPQQRAFDADLPLRGTDLVRLGLDGHRWGLPRPSRDIQRQVRSAVDAVDAAAFADKPVGRLSGGEQQRLRVAQALVGEPELILADEPLLSLDLPSQQQVSGLLDARRRAAGTTVVVVTHEINPVLPYADRVLYLANREWAVGRASEVLTSETLSRLYRAEVDVIHVRDRIVIVGTPDYSHHTEPPVRS